VAEDTDGTIIKGPRSQDMKRRVVLDLLAAARVLLEETEADIRRQDGALMDVTDEAERSERMQLILGLQQKRLRRALTVQRLQDALASSSDGEER
jgi:DNA-binding MarR family transcriptional regulator